MRVEKRTTLRGGRSRFLPQAFPLAWRQLQHEPRRVRRDTLDHVTQVDEGIDLEVLAGLDERTQDRGAVRRRFTAREEPVFAPQHDRS